MSKFAPILNDWGRGQDGRCKLFFSVLFGRTIAESKKKHEEKQLKAQQLRDKLRDEKTHKLQKLLERVSGHAVQSQQETPQPSPRLATRRASVSILPDRITKYQRPAPSLSTQLATDVSGRDVAQTHNLS